MERSIWRVIVIEKLLPSTSFDTCLYPNFSLDYTVLGHPHQAEVAEYSWQSIDYKCREATQNKK